AVRALQEMVDLRPALASFARVSYARELLGDGNGAVAAMRRALQSAGAPSDASWASHQLGQLHFNAGRLGAAWRAYRRARFLDPKSVPARAGLARVAAARRRYDRAIGLLREVTARVPAAEHVILLGEVYEAAGRPSAAARQYRLLDGIESLLESGGVNVDLEQALFDADHGLPRAALRAARAEWRRRKSVHVADALAWALYANERYGAAGRFAAKALRLGTRSALFHYHAGMIALRADRAAEAHRYLATALDINPYFSVRHAPVARRALASIGEVRR
ncbi:MAG: tetratricopeptide repeat protein, partial [Actinomycetota bacterium]